MTMRSEWHVLAEQCATATGAEAERREIAGSLAIAAGVVPDRFISARRGADLSGGDSQLSFRDCFYSAGRRWIAPDYAGSLDAITSLVESHGSMSYEVRRSATGDKGQATIWNPHRAPQESELARVTGRPSPALALCEAYCRARAETTP